MNAPPFAMAIVCASLLLAGCSPSASGVLRDAATERPVVGAVLEVRDSSWGVRGGQLVWDEEKLRLARSGSNGRFQLSGGGSGLKVAAPGMRPVETDLCATSPMIVRIGGPYAGLDVDRPLIIRSEGAAGGALSPASADRLGLAATGNAFGDGSELKFQAASGLRYVAGTGTIPLPPPLPYEKSVELDLGRDCGWLFVSDGTAPVAVVRIRPLMFEEEPNGLRRWTMFHTPLPRH